MSEFKLPDVGEGLTEAEIVLEGQGRRRHRDQRHHRRDRDREVPGRAAVAVRRHRARADGARGRDRRRGHADHLGRRPVRGAGSCRSCPRLLPRPPRPRWRSTCPTRAPRAVGRARAWSAATRRSVRRSAGPGSPRPPRASRPARAPPTRRSRAPSSPDLRRTSRCRRAEEPATSARTSAPAEAAHALVPSKATTPSEARALAKPPVRKLAKDLGIDLRTIAPTGPGGTVTQGRGGGGDGPPRQVSLGGRAVETTAARPANARPASRSRASAR